MRKLTATICLTVTILLGSVKMSASADFQKGLDAADRGDFATALREWIPLAEGDAAAQFNLGVMYVLGDGVQKNYRTAIKWFTFAALNGDDRAQAILDDLTTPWWKFWKWGSSSRDDKYDKPPRTKIEGFLNSPKASDYGKNSSNADLPQDAECPPGMAENMVTGQCVKN
jgi:hypothetical protein